MFTIRRRQFSNSPPSESEPEFKKYLDLFNKIVPTPTFDNLPLPKIVPRKVVTQRIQPPSYVSSESFREFYEKKEREEQARKKEVEERKARLARNKEEREMEKRKKAEERNQKKLEKERAQLTGKGKGKGKKRKQEEDSDEEEGQKIVVVYDDRSDDEFVNLFDEIDEDTCDVCKSDRDLDGWIGCECGR